MIVRVHITPGNTVSGHYTWSDGLARVDYALRNGLRWTILTTGHELKRNL